MRVIYLHQYFVTPQMSGGTRSYEMARRLVLAGHEVVMITADTSPSSKLAGRWREENIQGIDVHWLGVPYDNSFGFVRRLRAFIYFAIFSSWRAMRTRGDVVFATSTPLTIIIPAIFGSVLRRRPLVFEVRDLWPDVPVALGYLHNPILVALARGMEWLAYHVPRHVIALAPGMKEHIVSREVSPEKVSVIPNGCDLEEFLPAGDLRGPARKELGLSGDCKVVVFTGTLGRANGIEYLVDLAKFASAEMATVRFIVVGDGAMKESAEIRAEKYGILGTKMLFLGKRPKFEIPRWLGAADMSLALFVGPRVLWKDAVQNKFFDSLAAGRPVASNFDGWQSQLAEMHDIGVTLPQGDAKAAAQLLVRKLSDDKWLKEASLRARKVAVEKFSRDQLAGMLADVLTAVCDRAKK